MSSWQFLLSPSESVTQNWETSQATGLGTTQKKQNIKNQIKLGEPEGGTESRGMRMRPGGRYLTSEFGLRFPQAVRLALVWIEFRVLSFHSIVR